jgi:lipase (class 3)
MSFLVELDRSAYRGTALDRFAAASPFSLDNARAMMWMSQLAYETAHESKVADILVSFQMVLRALKSSDPVTGLPPKSACVVVAGGRDATIVAFSGTDPLKIEDWITDFNAPESTQNLHRGFQDAVETVWPDIKLAIKNRPPSEQALFFTGHSLGGALAIIAAEFAMRDPEVLATATAVYTFGSPRTGGMQFFNDYTPRLGDSTFRLVHGNDVVATVPPALLGDFHHVGRAILCGTDDDRFHEPPDILPPDNDQPDFAANVLQTGLADIRAFAALRFVRSIGPRPLDRLAGLLPRMVRDHVPTNYFRALSITV